MFRPLLRADLAQMLAARLRNVVHDSRHRLAAGVGAESGLAWLGRRESRFAVVLADRMTSLPDM